MAIYIEVKWSDNPTYYLLELDSFSKWTSATEVVMETKSLIRTEHQTYTESNIRNQFFNWERRGFYVRGYLHFVRLVPIEEVSQIKFYRNE
jgi:hypothetical protein